MGLKQFLTNNWRIINANTSNTLFINRCANSILESSKTGFAQQAVEDRVELPLKPKKPNPPFFQFLQEKRSEVMKNKNLRVKDAVREIGLMWKSFDEEIKKEMNEVYLKELEQYKQKISEYNQNLTVEQKNVLMRAKFEGMEQKVKRQQKKEIKELGKPRKPLTAYLMFVTEQMKNRGNLSVQAHMKIIANKWNEMDVNSKTKYFDKSSQENDKYVNDLKEWEHDMAKLGRFDLVRANINLDDKSTENN